MCLIVFGSTKAVLLLNTDRVVQVVQLSCIPSVDVAGFKVAGITGVIIGIASNLVIIEGLDVPRYALEVLKTAIWSMLCF